MVLHCMGREARVESFRRRCKVRDMPRLASWAMSDMVSDRAQMDMTTEEVNRFMARKETRWVFWARAMSRGFCWVREMLRAAERQRAKF